jgi:hypothetical protein
MEEPETESLYNWDGYCIYYYHSYYCKYDAAYYANVVYQLEYSGYYS